MLHSSGKKGKCTLCRNWSVVGFKKAVNVVNEIYSSLNAILPSYFASLDQRADLLKWDSANLRKCENFEYMQALLIHIHEHGTIHVVDRAMLAPDVLDALGIAEAIARENLDQLVPKVQLIISMCL